MDLTKYFRKGPLIPAVIQERDTNQVLMLAYINEESLKKTIETGYTWFFSRSRNELWNKGATSGHVQKVVNITPDCDDDTLLIVVEQTGPACHTGEKSCFFKTDELLVKGEEEGTFQEDPVDCSRYIAKDSSRDITKDCSRYTAQNSLSEATLEDPLRDLYQVVASRKETFTEGSYTCYLFEKGLDKILKKCGEECSEVIIAAKNLENAKTETEAEGSRSDVEGLRSEVENEICDLIYHLTVLMVNEGLELGEIYEILRERSKKIGNLKKFHVVDHNS